MKKFSKEELLSLIIIFVVLLVISIPNFVLSLRRARDQTRRDDMGALQTFLGLYHADFGEFPLSTEDGRVLACLPPGGKAMIDENGKLIADFIPCEWGNDGVKDLLEDGKVYINNLPNDPHASKGLNYVYFSDGSRYQIFASFEGDDEAEYDERIVQRKIQCGAEKCNMGRGYACTVDKSVDQCRLEQEGKL